MCERPSISKLFDRNSRFCIKILGFSFELLGFLFEIAHLCCQTRKERVQVRTYTCLVIPYPFVSSCTHFE